MQQLLNKILWKGKSRWQVAGASLGAFFGLFLLLSAVQFYVDVQQLLNGGNGTDQFVQINKKVNIFNMLGVKPNFTEEELAEIEAQPFVKKVGSFMPSQFRVSASMPSLGFRTDMFFEAVPDDFLDVKDSNFTWRKGQKEIPVIFSRDYLALYNFGFAPSQGLPALTPNTISKFSATVSVQGNGLKQNFEGRIVGLSDRINSILVPQSFMEWANENFGSGRDFNSSRLILSVDNPLSTELNNFLKEKGYEISQGKLIGGQFGILLKIVVAIIGIIGIIIVLLSALIFILNFQLTISQSKEDIRLLLQMGYKTKQISQILIKKLVLLFLQIVIVTFILLFALRYVQSEFFITQGFELSKGLHWTVYVAAAIFTLIFGFLNIQNIQKNVRKLFG